MRCEEKIPNGKLVSVEIQPESGIAKKVTITGDFFLHPEEQLGEVERSLEGLPLASDEAMLVARISAALGRSQLIGASAADIARLFRRAGGGV